MLNILVTGGCGFIGSHTVFALLKKGYRVFIFDSHFNSSILVYERLRNMIRKVDKSLVFNLEYLKGDLRIYEDVERLFKKAKKEGKDIHAVIHFAGLKAVNESIKKPLLYWDSNVLGSINLLKVMQNYSCKNLIFSSSATIYANPEKQKINESFSIKPINPYGNTKATIENFLKDIYQSELGEWRIINLRYFNPIGAHSSGMIGEDPKGKPNNIFPLILKVASKRIKELKIFGKDWNTYDGTCIRDYIHVMDLADGHIAACEYLSSNKSQISSFNIGTGKGYSVLELIETFQSVNNIKVPYSFAGRRKGDQEYVVADNNKIVSTLNWSPKRNIKDMCRDGWKWQKSNPNGYLV